MNTRNYFQFLTLTVFCFITIKAQSQFPDYPETKFIVFSDPHYFDASLGDDGKAFQDYLDKDRKLLRNSKELMEIAVEAVEKSDVDFVLVPGDLTKDGEKLNHQIMAEFFARIEKSGKKVYVIPGNHDINNPHAFKYMGDKTEKIPSVSPEEFAEIYSGFGFSEALLRDKNSLSYVAEPVKGMWLLGLDACRYKENPTDGHPLTSGKFSKETMQWIEEMLMEAQKQHKSVLTMMHHGAVEHYKNQKKLYGEYVVDNYKKLAPLFAEYGAKVVFTGHFHAQDITIQRFDSDKFVMDIETGSLVTYPCPYRNISISQNQVLTVKSDFIKSIPSKPEFENYSKEYVHNGIAGIAANTLIDMGVDSMESWSLSGQVANAFLAHYAGDEVTPEETFNMDGISFKGKFLIGFKKNLIKSLHKDLYPADNSLEIKLKLD